MASVANLTEEVIRIMSKSGCIGIKFGIESGSEKILKTIGKPIDLDKIGGIVRNCRKCGIKTLATFSIGLMGETEEDIKQTAGFVRDLAVDSIQVSIATPYPGTRFFRSAKEKGLLQDINWIRYDGKSSRSIYSPYPYGCKAVNLRRRLLLNWFLGRLLSPVWYLRHFRILLRTLAGVGAMFFIRQLISVIIDEGRNK